MTEQEVRARLNRYVEAAIKAFRDGEWIGKLSDASVLRVAAILAEGKAKPAG